MAKSLLLCILHIFIWVTFYTKKVIYLFALYIHGFIEMLSTPFKKVPSLSEIQSLDCTGRVAICTGGTAGIGLAVSTRLCRMNVTVIAAGPHPIAEHDMTKELHDFITQERLVYAQLDLASFASIRSFTKTFESLFHRLDYLINNAGVMLIPYTETYEGYEGHVGINFVGHYYLTDLLKSYFTDSTVIVNVSSSVHRLVTPAQVSKEMFSVRPKFYISHYAYCLSKLAILIYTALLYHKLRCKVIAVHPGVVSTSLYRHVWFPLRLLQKILLAPIFFRSVDDAASLIVNRMLNVRCTSGRYYFDRKSRKLEYSSATLDRCELLFHDIVE